MKTLNAPSLLASIIVACLSVLPGCATAPAPVPKAIQLEPGIFKVINITDMHDVAHEALKACTFGFAVLSKTPEPNASATIKCNVLHDFTKPSKALPASAQSPRDLT